VTSIPQRELRAAGLSAGAVGLGCMGMSWAYGAADRDDERSIAVIRRALQLGVTLLDTADVYGPFTNEELVGRALEGVRDEAVLATKCGIVIDDATSYTVHRNGRPEHVRTAVDASLRRLQTDRIDLYQLHRVDEDVPLEETWGAMSELVDAGKVLAIGLSEVSVAELERAQAIHPVASVQSELSLWTREPLDDVLPWCEEHGAAFIPFAPLGRGFFTGKLVQGSFGDDDFRARNPRFSDEAMAQNESLVAAVQEIAGRVDCTPAQIALAWTLAQGPSVIPIPGTKRIAYLEENAAAAEVELSASDLEELDALPAPVGARY
jgi:aryl-alcohol dehydrogenase-like predicted oxidoreductase